LIGVGQVNQGNIATRFLEPVTLFSEPRTGGKVLGISQLRRGYDLAGKILFSLDPRIPPHDQPGAAAGSPGHDYKLVSPGFYVSVDGRTGADKCGVNSIDEQRLNGGRPGIKRDPLYRNTYRLLELSRCPRVEGLRMSNIREITKAKRLAPRMCLRKRSQKQTQ
jgi:hypothetical protein